MRFKLRFQSEWPENLKLVWLLAGLLLAVTSLVLGSHRIPRWIPDAQLLCWLLVAASSWVGYCEFREDGLLVRQRGTKTVIRYESLAELRPRTDAYGVLAVTSGGKRIPIPVAQTPEFLREAYRRFPRLNPASQNPSFALI
jgi:hypothetical protein